MKNADINYSGRKNYIGKLATPLISSYVIVLVNTAWFENGYGILEKMVS